VRIQRGEAAMSRPCQTQAPVIGAGVIAGGTIRRVRPARKPPLRGRLASAPPLC